MQVATIYRKLRQSKGLAKTCQKDLTMTHEESLRIEQIFLKEYR